MRGIFDTVRKFVASKPLTASLVTVALVLLIAFAPMYGPGLVAWFALFYQRVFDIVSVIPTWILGLLAWLF